MIVELVGIPGAGKSVACQKAAAHLNVRTVDLGSGFARTASGMTLSWLGQRLAWAAAVAHNPLLLWRLRSTLRSRELVRLALELCRRDREVRRLKDSPRVIIVDEGPLHRLGWVLAMSRWEGELEPLVSRLCYPDLVVTMGADLSTALDRVGDRGLDNQLLAIDRSEALKRLAAYERWVHRLAGHAGRQLMGTDVDDTIQALAATTGIRRA